MGQVGKYIDEMCREHPDAMRRVLDMEFCSWGTYQSADQYCLVGTIRRARGLSANSIVERAELHGQDHNMSSYAATFASRVGRHRWRRLGFGGGLVTIDAICSVGTLYLAPLVKARIRRRLAEIAPPVVARFQPTRREVAYALGFEEPLVWHPDEVDTASPAELTLSG